MKFKKKKETRIRDRKRTKMNLIPRTKKKETTKRREKIS